MGNNAVSVWRNSFRGIRIIPSAVGAGHKLFVSISVRSDETCAESLWKGLVAVYTNAEHSTVFHFIFSFFDSIFHECTEKVLWILSFRRESEPAQRLFNRRRINQSTLQVVPFGKRICFYPAICICYFQQLYRTAWDDNTSSPV